MKKVALTLFKELLLLFIGGIVYVGIELFARGYSHWSMFIVGGLCFVAIGLINEFYSWEIPIQWQCLIGSAVITILEFISGCIVNLFLNWNVWDYSDKPLNLLGQICLHHSVIYWIPLSAIAIVLDDIIRYAVFNEDEPHYSFKKKKKRR